MVRLNLAIPLLALLPGCATLGEVAALRRVDFALQDVTDGTLAGIPLGSFRTPEQIGAGGLARLALALANESLPFGAAFQIRASNPADNVQARILRFGWTFFMDDRETVSGIVEREHLLPPGRPVTVPIRVELDLLDFFDAGLEPLLSMALAIAGAGEPSRFRLELTPTLGTPLGPVTYPEPIRIEPFIR